MSAYDKNIHCEDLFLVHTEKTNLEDRHKRQNTPYINLRKAYIVHTIRAQHCEGEVGS